MGLLDELKKLTKPYDDEDYLEEDLAEPVRAPGRAADARSYASYAEAPRSAEPVQPTRRPYVFSNQRAAAAEYIQKVRMLLDREQTFLTTLAEADLTGAVVTPAPAEKKAIAAPAEAAESETDEWPPPKAS